MGLFSSAKSTSGSAQKWAQPYAKAAAGTVQDVYGANAPGLADISGKVSSVLPGLLDRFNAGNPAVDAAQGYATDVLGGKYMAGNPHLEGMIGKTLGDVTDRVGAAYGSRGSFGGTAWTSALGEALANAELGLRYGNYGDEMNRMAGAAGMAPSLAQAQYTGLPEILQTSGVAAELPYTGINALSGNLASLFSGGVQKGPGIGGQILGGLAQGAGAALAASDRRLKTNIRRVGTIDNGLPWYKFRYVWDAPDEPLREGLMSDDVRKVRPQAVVIDRLSGFDMVFYPLAMAA